MSSARARAVLAHAGLSRLRVRVTVWEREAGAGHRLPEARQTRAAVRVTAEAGRSDTEPKHEEGSEFGVSVTF